MPTGQFQSQFVFFKLRNDGVWFESLPAISVDIKKSATNLSGTYTITYPNPAGIALGYFTQFDNQELWFAHTPTNTMHRVMAGQINSLAPAQKLFLEINGRGLTGMLTDRKISTSWSSKRGDFILCDPTYGVIPANFTNVTTWNAFTDDFDRFDYWDTGSWGSQPAWADTVNSNLEVTGDAGATRKLTDVQSYNYETLEFRAKVSVASNTIRFGFTDATRTNYVLFELAAAAVNCKNADGLGSQSSATVNAVTQTNWNYYRIEWASGLARFFVNGVLEVSQASNVPVSLLYPFMEVDQTVRILTADYVKMIAITTLFDTYIANDKIAMDLVNDVTDVGNTNTNFSFYIDDDWDFNAYAKNAVASGYSYGYNSSIYNGTYQKLASVELNDEAKDLYNKIKIRGGEVLNTVTAPTWTDQFTGNGTQKAYALGYKANKPLTLLQVNGVTKTENTDFTVTYGAEHTIVQFTTAPPNTQSVNVRYNYYTPIIATATNDASINQYGIAREYSESDETITSQNRASSLAIALLAFYSDPRTVIKVKLPLDPRLLVGETVNIDAPYFGINNSAYEIIELGHTMASGKWETNLTLASTEINTAGEIIRQILQQLKALKNRGDTNIITVDETKLTETMGLTQYFETYVAYSWDSFLLGNSTQGVLGRGVVLENWEAGVGSWTGSNCTPSSETTKYLTYIKSLKLVASASPFNVSTTQSFGNLSAYSGVSAGAPSTGTLGVWIYCTVGDEISSITLRVGSGASDYTEVAGVKKPTGTFGINQGWNYYVFRLKDGATTGTPDWTAVDYVRIVFASSGTPTIYADYFTIGTGDIIALNGLGYRTGALLYIPVTVT